MYPMGLDVCQIKPNSLTLPILGLPKSEMPHLPTIDFQTFKGELLVLGRVTSSPKLGKPGFPSSTQKFSVVWAYGTKTPGG